MNRQQRIRTLLLLTWMAVIFLYSARPADVSTQDSHLIGSLVADAVQRISQEDWSDREQLVFVEGIDFYVRKAAHLTEYAVLGALLASCMQSFGIVAPRLFWYALAAGILYAVSDELHQYFVPGRACQLRDMAIDGIGVGLGAAGFLGWGKRNGFTSIFCKGY